MRRGDQTSLKAKLLILCVGLGYLLTMAMAVCPELHHWAHPDCDESEHHCMVSAIANGQMDSDSPAPLDVAYVPSQIEAIGLARPEQALPIFLAAFALEHAPPAA